MSITWVPSRSRKLPVGALLRASGTVTRTTVNAPAWHFGAAWRFRVACFVAGSGTLPRYRTARFERRTGRRRTGTTLANDTLFEERAPGTLGSTESTNSDKKQTRTAPDELKYTVR